MQRFIPRPTHPYAHAPRLPEVPGEEPIGLDVLFGLQDVPREGLAIEIEIGPGRGGFMIERCEARSDVYILGFEIRLKWATLVDERLKKRGLGGRGRVFAEDAREALSRLGPDASVNAVFLHFPDPWWKKRHEKRLVMSDPLLAHTLRLLKDEGELFVQTDVEERAVMYEQKLSSCELLLPSGDTEGSARLEANPYQARSPREHQAIRDGLPIYRMRYRRKPR